MRTLLLLCTLATLTACKRIPPGPPAAPTPPPAGQVVFFQTFDWSDGESTDQGMAWFTTTPGGKTVGVTSAHFLDQDGPRMLKATWRSPADTSAAALTPTATRTLGRPGDEGIFNDTTIDLRADYVVFSLDGPLSNGWTHVLTLDDRTSIPRGEGVWLPFPDWEGREPRAILTGSVADARSGYIELHFTGELDLMGHSGSPIISQRTGQVIGMLARGGAENGKTIVVAAPVTKLIKVIAEAEAKGETHSTKDVIGSK